jgi:hypothetical protein
MVALPIGAQIVGASLLMREREREIVAFLTPSTSFEWCWPDDGRRRLSTRSHHVETALVATAWATARAVAAVKD